jgi:signal transduction histidine kinase
MVDISSETRRERELEIGREVAHAFLSATTSHEVYRLALGRVTPLVRARFSSVFVPDREDETLLRLRCAHNWPGALTFYFDRPHEFTDDERHLLLLVADQVTATSRRAEQLEALQQELEHLRSDNRQLEQTLGAIGEANRRNDELLARASHELRAPTTSILSRAHFLSCGAALS